MDNKGRYNHKMLLVIGEVETLHKKGLLSASSIDGLERTGVCTVYDTNKNKKYGVLILELNGWNLYCDIIPEVLGSKL